MNHKILGWYFAKNFFIRQPGLKNASRQKNEYLNTFKQAENKMLNSRVLNFRQ